MEDDNLISRAKVSLLLWWSVISYIILFTLQSLCSAIIGALTGKLWHDLSHTDKLIIVCTIISQWSITMLAFLNSAIKELKADKTKNTNINSTNISSVSSSN